MAADLSLDRIGRITGSRVAGVLGLSPYSTRSEVMREMVREYHWAEAEFQGNFITDFGKEHEQDGIAEYELMREVSVENTGADQLTVVHDAMRLAVTPDGWVDYGIAESMGDAPEGLVEVKCPWRGLYNHWHDRPDYEAQMRLQLFATEREWADFVVWRHEGTPISRLYYDFDREGNRIDWMAEVWPELEKFLDEYDRIVDSEELSAPFLEPIQDRRTDDEWAAAEATYWDLVYESNRAAEQLAEAKKALEQLADGQSTKGNRIHLVFVPPKPAGSTPGAISYKSALEALVPEEKRTPAVLDGFRGKPGKSGGGRGSFTYRRIEEAQ